MLTGEIDKHGGDRKFTALYWCPVVLLIKWAITHPVPMDDEGWTHFTLGHPGGRVMGLGRSEAFFVQIPSLTCPAEAKVLCDDSHLHINTVCVTGKTWEDALDCS